MQDAAAHHASTLPIAQPGLNSIVPPADDPINSAKISPTVAGAIAFIG
jgi:hypothetical protein